MYNANITITDENGKLVFEGSLHDLAENEKEQIKDLYFNLASRVEAGNAVALIDD